jgi:inner membrane protein
VSHETERFVSHPAADQPGKLAALDNVTHAIAGALTAELLICVRRRFSGDGARTEPAFERAAWAVSMLAQNLPDADSLYTGVTGGVLGYLLHHRGHTHTIALAPVVALVAYALVAGWARLGRKTLTSIDRRWLAGIALLGPFAHMALDASNEYGVHPFWPFASGWFYGDTIFIIEPLFWAAAIPALFAATTWLAGRVVWGALLALGVALTWGVGFVPWPSALATTALGVVAIVVARRGSPVTRVTFAFVSSLVVVAVFAWGSAAASTNVRAALAEKHPDWETLDVSRSPLPATPLCWQVVAVQRSRDGLRYALRRAEVSAWPAVVTASACMRGPSVTTARLAPGDVRERAAVVTGQLEMPLADLREHAERCDVAAYLRWARAPFFATILDGDGDFIAGDLRYDRSPDIEFAEARFPRTIERCPRWIPPWRPPRSDLLTPR